MKRNIKTLEGGDESSINTKEFKKTTRKFDDGETYEFKLIIVYKLYTKKIFAVNLETYKKKEDKREGNDGADDVIRMLLCNQKLIIEGQELILCNFTKREGFNELFIGFRPKQELNTLFIENEKFNVVIKERKGC